jgi:hypothetical protein
VKIISIFKLQLMVIINFCLAVNASEQPTLGMLTSVDQSLIPIYQAFSAELAENGLVNFNEVMIKHKARLLERLKSDKEAYKTASWGLGSVSTAAIQADNAWYGDGRIKSYINENLPKTTEDMMSILNAKFTQTSLSNFLPCLKNIKNPLKLAPVEFCVKISTCGLSHLEDNDVIDIFKIIMEMINPST